MNYIFTPEEARMPVTYEKLAAILEEVTDEIADGEGKYRDAYFKSFKEVITPLVDRVKDLEYRHIRDVYCFMNAFSSLSGNSRESWMVYYRDYCAEFDRTNKKEDKNES